MGAIENYPYNPGINGLPLKRILDWRGYQEGFYSGSKKLILCTVRTKPVREIGITDYNDVFPRLQAHVYDDILTLDLRTMHDKIRHPDFFATKFIDAALEFFTSCGIQIRQFEGNWEKWSTNYAQFMYEYERTYDVVRAALSTWSGRTMNERGFHVLTSEDVKFKSYGVQVTMSKQL